MEGASILCRKPLMILAREGWACHRGAGSAKTPETLA